MITTGKRFPFAIDKTGYDIAISLKRRSCEWVSASGIKCLKFADRE